MKIKNIIIIGPGLIGGSIAKSLRKCGQKFHLTAVCKNKSETLEVEKLKIFDKITSGIYSSLFVETDLVLVCSPVSTISKIINKISGFIKNNCIVSDVGSIKHNIYKGLTAESKKKYIGSHPMTGSEKSGVKNSESSILENAVVIVTKTRESGKTDILRLTEFWKFMK
nr:prephenate dehydrogenase/arogenate dehydrogenase family protein [bacterium]